MLYFEFGQDRLAEAHALNAFELSQGAIEVALEARFVTEQVIELRSETNVLAKRFQLQLLGFDGGACTSPVGRSASFSSQDLIRRVGNFPASIPLPGLKQGDRMRKGFSM